MQHGQRKLRALDGFDFIAFGAQPDTQESQQPRVVVDQQDFAFGISKVRYHLVGI
jgi:hypothetical protein